MNLIKKTLILQILNLALLNISVGMGFEQKYYYTIYGNVSKLNLNQTYEKEENLLGFCDEKAFPQDQALHYTTKYNVTVKAKFCVTDPIPAKNPIAFRILSFNVHNFHKVCDVAPGKMRKDPAFALDVIKNFHPNIVMLQEIVPYPKTEEAAKNHISKKPSLIPIDFSFFDKKMEDLKFPESVKVNDFQHNGFGVFMGKAIYTPKNTILNIKNDNLNGEQAKDRGYLRILFKYPNSEEQILLYTVHLSYFNQDLTTLEIKNLVKAIEKDIQEYKTENTIIMGDFNNDPFPPPAEKDDFQNVFNALKKDFKLLNDNTKSNFNQDQKAFVGDTVDLAWVSNAFLEKFNILNPKSGATQYTVVVKSEASDHWPIYIDFSIKGKESEDDQL